MNRNPKRTILTSGTIARTRAGLTVSADRLDLSPERVDELRREVTDVLAKYINTEDENIKIRITFACEFTEPAGRASAAQRQTTVSGPDGKRGISDVKTIQIK